MNLSEYAKKCAAELKANKCFDTGKPLTEFERGGRTYVLDYRAKETANWRYKQQFENVSQNKMQNKSVFLSRDYSKNDIDYIFADNEILAKKQ